MRDRAGRSVGRWVVFGGALAVHLIVLYAPAAPAAPSALPRLDLLVHVLVFAAVAVTALRLPARVVPVVAILVLHAFASELLQASVLADRSGDPLDVAADLVGTVGGTAAVLAVRRRRSGG